LRFRRSGAMSQSIRAGMQQGGLLLRTWLTTAMQAMTPPSDGIAQYSKSMGAPGAGEGGQKHGGHSHGGGSKTTPYPGEDIFGAAKEGHTTVATQLIENDGGDPNCVDQFGFSPLHRAVNADQVEMTQLLVYLGANLDVASGDSQETPLHWACRNGQLDMVKSLISMGADIHRTDSLGWTPLHHVCGVQGGSLLVAHYLVSVGASFHEVDHEGRTPLHLASQVGSTDLCYYLVTHGASVHAFDRKGDTPAQSASKKVPQLFKLLQADDESAIEALAPWHSFEETFKRPNEYATTTEFALPIICVPVMFYLFGAFPWYVSVLSCAVLMFFVSQALMPARGQKAKAQPTFHAFYIGCVLTTYGVWFSVVGLGGKHIGPVRLFVFLASTICLAICFFIASYTDPGVLKPQAKDYNDVLLAVAKGFNLDGLCKTCCIRKPLRSKHCSVLDVCVAQFDHFCPWCNNAVGSRNYLGFYGWCFFEAVCHAQLIYDIWSYLLREINATHTFPFFTNLIAINALHPSILYILIFNIMSLLMAGQLVHFQTGNVKVNLTTNERMNAFRYSYLMQYLQTELVGNPFDRGGWKANMKELVTAGLIPVLPKLEYKSIPFDVDCKMASHMTNELHYWEGGKDIRLGNGQLVSAGAHRWLHAERKRVAAINDETRRILKEDDLRYGFIAVLRKLATYPEHSQRQHFEALASRDRPGSVEEQLEAVMAEMAAEQESKINQQFGMSKQEHADLLARAGLGTSKKPASSMKQGEDGVWRNQQEEAEPKKPKEATHALVDERQKKMMAHMVEQQKTIAREVMLPEQLEVFEEGVKEMERQVSLQDKQRAMQKSQVQLSTMLTDEQAATIQQRISAAMQAYVAQHGHPNQPAAIEAKSDAAVTEPEGSPRSEEEEASESDDSGGLTDSDEEDDPLAKQGKMVSFMLEQQLRVAKEVMDAAQLAVYESGRVAIENATTMQEKQAAMVASKAQWLPLLSEPQQAEMKSKMEQAMATYRP